VHVQVHVVWQAGENSGQLSETLNFKEIPKMFLRHSNQSTVAHSQQSYCAVGALYNTNAQATNVIDKSRTHSLVSYNFASTEEDRMHLSVMHSIIDGQLPFAFVNYQSAHAHLKLVAPIQSVIYRCCISISRYIVTEKYIYIVYRYRTEKISFHP